MIRIVVGLLLMAAASFGCATVELHTEGTPPVLAPDEVLRPYDKVGTIEVGRTRYGEPGELTPDDYQWAYTALRNEAAGLKADAVIYPEVTIKLHKFFFYSTTDIKAKGIAIKFR
ncbi:hypothetical protein [Geomonas sp.]|uniref:hypothetical protein n=1 Tax=Geomonas sp. TaxID=2651584 RepID=UPI002B46DAC4|nr:hypothetical protein [Geomonas sp.]